MRVAITIIAVVIYLVSFNLYVINIPNPHYLPEIKKLWYNYTTALLLLYYTLDGWRGYKSWMHEQMGRLCIIVVLCNFTLIIATHHGWIQNAWCSIIVYNLLWLIISIMVFVSAWKNGLFN